jgi:Mlc titration factor MtfA (ptsG expression regulator)
VPWWRRRRARELPSGWADLVAGSIGEWRYLDEDERRRLGELIDRLLADKGWEAARGFVLTDEMCTVIAAQAALMVLGLDLDAYRDVRAIIVHPTTVTSRVPRPGPVPGVITDEPIDLLGEAHQQRGPVVLAWDALLDDARHPGTGRNVVVHEFAHKLDMLDGLIDGTPPVPGREAYERWVSVCTAEYQRLRTGGYDPLLRDYAAQDPGEFFAVAAEVFFDQPELMHDLKPELYGVFVDYFRQDPAGRRGLA